MGRKLYVGNLASSITGERLESVFGQHGTVELAQLIADRDTGHSRGFAFVEMRTDADAQAAIAQLNGAELDGLTIKVNEAKPPAKRAGRSRAPFNGRGRW